MLAVYLLCVLTAVPRTCALCAPARASRVTPRCCRCPAAARCCGAAGPGAEGRAAAAGRARGRRRPPTLTTASPRRAPGPSPCTTSAAATTTASVSWAPGPRTASRVSTIISSLLLTPPASIDCLPGIYFISFQRFINDSENIPIYLFSDRRPVPPWPR